MNTQDRQAHTELLALRANQVQRGGARAAVLGVNDGLVSTLCLVVGVAAASSGNSQAVLLAGFAGLVAGAISMGIGEWISVRAQVELFEGVLTDVKRLIKADKPLLEEQLEENLIAAGISKKTAHTTTLDIAHDDKHLFDLYSSRVLGVNKDELGSPWIAAFSSCALFTAGALVALAPWFFVGGTMAIILSICSTALGSLIVGGYVAHSSGKHVVFGALRQLLIVLLASVVTYGIGHLLGVAVS